MRRRRLLVAGICVALVVGLAAWLLRPPKGEQGGCQIPTDPNPFAPDAVVGFTHRPGRHTFPCGNGEKGPGAAFVATIDERGERLTSPSPGEPDARPELWAFGCSFAWGFAVNDEESFPWRLQALLPELRVRNRAGAAHGNLQALLRLRADLAEGEEPTPRVAVFSFLDFHPARNLPAREWIAPFSSLLSAGAAAGIAADELARYRHPWARLDSDGALQTGLAALDQPPPADNSEERQIAVTNAIFDAILATCRQFDVLPVLALFKTGIEQHPVVQHCRKAGFLIVETSFFEDSRPLDRHPNARTHEHWAERVAESVRTHL